MAKSKITGKTFEEMLSKSIELDLSAKFKDIIYEFISDVHAMGMVVYSYQEGNSKFLFKDSSFKKPVTDNELLAMYLDEVVATRLVDSDMSLERCGYFETEKVNFLEYKEDNFVKKFYKIGNYFSGETYFDLNGFAPGDSELALVDSAIVDTSVVGEEEAPPMQTIWEGTFVAESSGGQYGYETPNVQNGELIKNCNEVTVTFDGISYVLPVNQAPFGFVFGDETLSDIPFVMAFGFQSELNPAIEIVRIMTKTEGSHTLKVEGTPSGDEPSGDTMRVLYDGTPSVGEAQDNVMVYNMSLTDLLSLKSYSKATLTIDGVSHIANIVEVENPEATSYPPYYVLGVNYPPTEFDYDVGVMLTCKLSKTGSETYSAYIVEPIRERMTEHHVKIEVDENDARRVPVPGGELNL